MPWTAISSLLHQISTALQQPKVLLWLNLAYFVPSMPALLLHSSLQDCLERRLGVPTAALARWGGYRGSAVQLPSASQDTAGGMHTAAAQVDKGCSGCETAACLPTGHAVLLHVTVMYMRSASCALARHLTRHTASQNALLPSSDPCFALLRHLTKCPASVRSLRCCVTPQVCTGPWRPGSPGPGLPSRQQQPGQPAGCDSSSGCGLQHCIWDLTPAGASVQCAQHGGTQHRCGQAGQWAGGYVVFFLFS